MNITDRFTPIDFMGYFFPGVVSLSGIYLLVLLTPFAEILSLTSIDLVTGFVLLVFSYMFGVIQSTFSQPIAIAVNKINRHNKYYGFRAGHEEIRDGIIGAFERVFDIKIQSPSDWSSAHVALCRALIKEYMPNGMGRAERQSAVWILRRNLLGSFFIWLLVGVGWSIWCIRNGFSIWGYLLLIFTIIAIPFAFVRTIKRMRDSQKREVNYVMESFLAGYSAGAFSDGSKREK